MKGVRMRRLIIPTNCGNVVLKQLVPADAPLYFLLVDADRPHLSQFGNETASKYPDEASVLQSILNPPNPKKLRFGVWEGESLVGTINLTPLGKGRGEIGYWTSKAFCRMGYATIASRTLAAYAKRRLGLKRVIARAYPKNVESHGVLARAHFKQVRRTEKSYYFVYDGPLSFPPKPPFNPRVAFRQLQNMLPGIQE
jgi:RimJ/RimL family protein N-acetyltransferase